MHSLVVEVFMFKNMSIQIADMVETQLLHSALLQASYITFSKSLRTNFVKQPTTEKASTSEYPNQY